MAKTRRNGAAPSGQEEAAAADDAPLAELGIPPAEDVDSAAQGEPVPDAPDELAAEPEGDAADAQEWQAEVDPSYLQSKYTLVSIAAKRARQLLDGSTPRVATLSEKPVTVALEELTQGKLVFVRLEDPR